MTTYRRSRGSIQPWRVYRYPLDQGGHTIDTKGEFGDKNRNLPWGPSIGTGGIFHGNPPWRRDHVVGNYIRTSTNNYIEGWASAVHNFTSTRSFSVSVWVKPETTFGNFPPFVNHVQAGATIGWALFCWSGGSPNNGECHMYISDGTHSFDTYSASAKSCSDGRWHLITGVCDRVKQVMRCYTDLYSPIEVSISTVGSLIGDTTSALKIGQGPAFGGTDGFVGGIHDLRIYEDRILHATDIVKIYNEKMRVSSRIRRWEMAGIGVSGGGGGGSIQNSAVTVIS